MTAPGAPCPDSTAETNVSGVIADYLVRAGVPYFFGYPGTSNIELMELARRRGVETVLARREGTAGFMAEGLALATGGVGVCVSTLGPGSSAFANPVAAATLDRVPLIAISGQVSTAREPTFTHQVIDHNRLFAPITKATLRMEPAAVDAVMRRALRVATAERPGAVHLTVHDDVAEAPASLSGVALPPIAPTLEVPMMVRAAGGAEPVSALRGARRPVVLAGAAAVRLGAGPAVAAFAERCGVPVVVSPMGKGVVSEDLPWFAGVLDMACNQVVWDLLDQADLILAVGFDPVELIKPWPLRTPVVHIDAVPNTDQVYEADVEIVGAVGASLTWLGDEADIEPRWTLSELDRHRGKLRAAYYAGRVQGRLNPTDVVDTMRAWAPQDAIVTTDVGSHKMLVGQGWATWEPRTCLMSNGLSSMGFSLPAAIGAQLALPARPVICTVGDGGFAMVQGELSVASELGLGIVVLVFCDGSLNRIELKQMRLGYPSTATRIPPTDLVMLAASMGCEGVRVDSVADLEKVLGEIDITGLTTPLVIDARIDPAQYDSQF